MSGLFSGIEQGEAGLFPSVIGQERVKNLLQRILASKRLGHSYLFVGQEGTGRTAIALEIARVLNCNYDINSSVHGCDCQSCKMISKWHHPNLMPIFPLPPIKGNPDSIDYEKLDEILTIKRSDTYSRIKLAGLGFIRVVQIRELKKQLSLIQDKPGIRTVIVSHAERMNAPASNALLKLLEEPPDKSCILLITDTVRNLLPTIVSRCQIFSLQNLSTDEIEQALTSRAEVSAETAKSAALLSGGSYTHARALVNDGIEEQVDESLKFLRTVVMGNVEGMISKLDEWNRVTDKSTVFQFLFFITVWLKNAIVLKSFSDGDGISHLSIVGQEQIIGKMAERYSQDMLEQALFEIESTKLIVDTNANIHLTLTALGIKLQRILS